MQEHILGGRSAAQFVTDSSQSAMVSTECLNDTNDSVTAYPKCSYYNTAASVAVKSTTGQCYGIVINSHTTGTVKLWDNTAASGTVILETITLNVGERFIDLYGLTFGTGLYITLGGTANVTVLYR